MPANQALRSIRRNFRDLASVGKRFQARTRRRHLNGRGELVERCHVVRHRLLDSAVCPLQTRLPCQPRACRLDPQVRTPDGSSWSWISVSGLMVSVGAEHPLGIQEVLRPFCLA